MDVGDVVREHYSGADLEHVLLQALREVGLDPDALEVNDLAGADQLHAGGLAGTSYLLRQLDLGPDARLLDVGCGVGGPARVAARQYRCRVVGVDLSPDFVRLAEHLTHRVGLTELVQHQVAAGEHLQFDDASFDRAMMLHVGMNIQDKVAVFTEVCRVLRPGGLFGLYEQMKTGNAAPTYPLLWAEDDTSSFLASPDSYVDDLKAAGFAVERVENRTGVSSLPTPGQPRLTPAALFGPSFAERLRNSAAATRAGLVQPVLVVARAPG